MTPTDSDKHTTEEKFLHHGPNQEPTPGKNRIESRNISQCPVRQPVVSKSVRNTIRTWEQYCALSIKVDLPAGAVVDQALDAALLELIYAMQNENQAVGCRWTEGLYFCALANTDVEAAHVFARKFQEQLGHRRPETVTIGIAPFPQLMFSRSQSLINTCKALDHAAFFGPGSIGSLDATSLNISGDRHYHTGELDRATAEYRTGLELNPCDANIHNSLGICLAKQGDLTAAGAAFNTAVEIDPHETMAIYNLGMVALLQGDPEQAAIRFHAAYAQNREIYEIPFQIGKLLAEQGNWQEALEHLNAAIALNDSHWRLFHLKGACLAKLGEDAKAIQAYSRSVKINPGDADGLFALACLYDDRDENPDICHAFFQQSIRLNPQNGLFHHRLGRWHHKHGQTDLAMAAYLRASALGFNASREIAALGNADEDAEVQTVRCA